jgi:hypothetical protein
MTVLANDFNEGIKGAQLVGQKLSPFKRTFGMILLERCCCQRFLKYFKYGLNPTYCVKLSYQGYYKR